MEIEGSEKRLKSLASHSVEKNREGPIGATSPLIPGAGGDEKPELREARNRPNRQD